MLKKKLYFCYLSLKFTSSAKFVGHKRYRKQHACPLPNVKNKHLDLKITEKQAEQEYM